MARRRFGLTSSISGVPPCGESALIPLFVLSRPDPLRWAPVWYPPSLLEVTAYD